MPSPIAAISFVLLLSAFAAAPAVHALPFVILHGIGDRCKNRGLSNFINLLSEWSGAEGYCLEDKSGVLYNWMTPIEEQANAVCEKLKEIEELQGGYNLVGLSQGNMIGRAVLEFCDGAPPVKNYVSLGGPHAGTASVPMCGSAFFCVLVDELIDLEIYSDYVQEHLAPAGYLKIPTDMDGYLKGCKFLPKLNNEIASERNVTYKERFSSLQNLVLIMFESDLVLVPKETAWFGYYPDGAFSPVLPPEKTSLYVEDWIGLRTLNESGRVKFVSVPGGHLSISKSNMKKYILPYLIDDDASEQSSGWGFFMSLLSVMWETLLEITGLNSNQLGVLNW